MSREFCEDESDAAPGESPNIRSPESAGQRTRKGCSPWQLRRGGFRLL